jgi:glycerol uptake facilitator-like aquaporin
MFRGFEWNKVLPYSFAQVLGSSAGSAMSYIMNAQAIEDFEVSQDLSRASAIPSARVFGEYYDPSLTGVEAFGVEAFGTAVLAAVVFAVSHPRAADRISIPVPLIIGCTVFSLICFLAPLTQCGMNPARDFGPRLVAYLAGWTDVAFQDCSLYILAPLIGAPMGAALVDNLLYARKDLETTEGQLSIPLSDNLL